MPTSSKSAAAHTAADLDAMDDKLRCLGLDVDHIGSSSATVTQGQSSEDYLRRIRAAKAEKQWARFDRMARQAVVVEKQRSVKSAAKAVGKTADMPSIEETSSADKALLASDIAETAMRVRENLQKMNTQLMRAERTLQSAQQQREQQQQQATLFGSAPTGLTATATITASNSGSIHKEEVAWTSTALARTEAKRQAITPWCTEVAEGVVELAIEISDNRHLPATGLAGRPVYRLQQDLGVTQWREWVEQLVFARAAAASTAAELQAKAAEAARHDGSDLAAAAAAAHAQALAEENAIQRDAVRCIEVAAQLEAEEAAQVQQKAVAAILTKLQAEVGRQRRADEEAVRREADELGISVHLPNMEGSGATSTVTVQREEVLPGWSQRMPPAGCFVYGDDLSGTRLLSDTIEVYMQRCLCTAQQNTTAVASKAQHHPAHVTVTASDSMEDTHRGLSGENVDAVTPSASAGKAAAAENPFAHFTPTEIGIEHEEGGSEGGITVTYVTPKTLVGAVTAVTVGGDGRRAGSASRSTRLQTHSTTAGAIGGISQSATGANNNAGGGGGGGSAVRGGRRASLAASDGRRSADQQLIEAAVKEVVRVHRHNLGVLMGDKMLSVLPTKLSPATSGLSCTAESDEATAKSGQAPLQTLLLVGFPDTAAFAEHFADHLRTAITAAETELLEEEARRRAAEQQAVVTAAAETGKQRTLSTKNNKGALGSPARQKASRLPKATVEAEETAVTALVEQLRLTFALPPLSILSVFLAYDIPTRERRLEDAAFAPGQQQQQQPPQLSPLHPTRGMSDSGEDDMVAAVATGDATCEFMHPVYHPWKVDERDLDSSHAESFRRPVSVAAGGGGGIGTSAASTMPLTFATSSAPPQGFLRAVDVWSVPCLRTELEQQDARQHMQRQAWTSAVTAASVKLRDIASAVSELRRVPASFYVAGRRREKTLVGSAVQDADRPTPMSRQTSLTLQLPRVTDGATLSVNSLGSPLTPDKRLKHGTSHLLPRTLFFARVLDVSDATTVSTAMAADTAADAHALGTKVWCGCIASTAGISASTMSDSVGEQRSGAARAATVNQILSQLHLFCRPAGGRALSGDLLVPYQLPEPFRLGDYRLSEATCLRLRQVHEAYGHLLPEPSSVLRTDRAGTKHDIDAVMKATTAAMYAETESWGAVLQYAEDLFSLIAFDVFRDDGDGVNGGSATDNEGKRLIVTAGMLNSTARFTNIDRSYAQAKDAIAQQTARAVAHIQDCLAVLLRLSLDVCVTRLAATVRLFFSVLNRQQESKANIHSSPLSAPEIVDNGIEEQLLMSMPRLPEVTARELVALLHVTKAATSQARENACDKFEKKLSQVYWANVKQTLMEVMSQYFTQRTEEQAAAENAATTKGTESDVQNGGDPPPVSNVAAKSAAQTILIANLSVMADALLEHATATAPSPFMRLILLLQELQQKTQSLHDGADAWVELLYHDVLAAQSANMNRKQQQKPKRRRPQSIDQLAEGPQVVIGSVTTSATATTTTEMAVRSDSSPHPQPSRWQCGELEVFLATMPQPGAAGLVTTTSFQRGLLKNQFPRIWRFLPDSTETLAAQVSYTVTTTPEEVEPLRRNARCFTPALSFLPDTALDAYLVHDCPCRTSAFSATVAPFLTVENTQCLCMLATGDGRKGAATSVSSPSTSLRASLFHLQKWLLDVALNRCCFCENGRVCGAGGGGGAAPSSNSTTASHRMTSLLAFTRCATRRVIAPPSTRALRQTILSLPADVLEQVPTLATEQSPSMVFLRSALPTSPYVSIGWMQAQWWWLQNEEEMDTNDALNERARHNTALCWALWRILLRPAPPLLAKNESDTAVALTPSAAATASPLIPSLLSLLRLLLIGAADDTNPREERVRRAFHSLSALRCVREGKDEWHMLDGDDNVSVAVTIEDEMTLSREEYGLLGKLLVAPVPAQMNGATVSGIVDFITDVELLLLVDRTEQVTLPLLLSSRWAKLLLAAHF